MSISEESRIEISPNILCMLFVAVAQSSSGSII